MPLARFKDLCIDAIDVETLGVFWAGALGLALEHRENGNAVLIGPSDAHRVWINQVPEPKSVKHRVHLDVHGSSADRLVGLGASVVDAESFRWVVMADPEGGEFCLFVREEPPRYLLYEVSVNCTDHVALSAWWTSLLGGRQVRDDEEGFSWVEAIPGAPFDALVFAPVPEPKATKNRIHLDVVASSIEPLLDAGASLLRTRDDEITWSVLADPEGNELCVFRPA